MRKPTWKPSLLMQEGGSGAGWTYLVADRSKRSGCFYKETAVDHSTLEQVIVDLAEGQFVNPTSVVGFSIHEGRARDFSADVARHVQNYARARGLDLPRSTQDFVERYQQKSKKSA